MTITTPYTIPEPKDPSDVLDYVWDFNAWLDGDTISSVVMTTPTGITLNSNSNTTTRVTAWYQGGTAGTDYTCACKIVTAGGRTCERSIVIQVKTL